MLKWFRVATRVEQVPLLKVDHITLWCTMHEHFRANEEGADNLTVTWVSSDEICSYFRREDEAVMPWELTVIDDGWLLICLKIVDPAYVDAGGQGRVDRRCDEGRPRAVYAIAYWCRKTSACCRT